MKKNTYISIIRTLGCLLLLSVFVSSCLYEEPELTADGELGVDPTAVNIMTNLTLETSFDPVNVNRGTRAAATTYLHRFVVAVYEGHLFGDNAKLENVFELQCSPLGCCR